MQFVDFKNTHAMLMATVDRYRDQPAYRWFTAPGQTESVTWGEFYNQVRQVAKSLMALGVEPGDKVNIISYSCYRWVLTDMGITSAGAATVGIYQSNLPKDCQYIIDHSDAVVVFAEDNQQMDKLFEIRPQIPDVRKVILFSGDAPDDDWVISYEDFLALGQDVSDKDFDQRAQADNAPGSRRNCIHVGHDRRSQGRCADARQHHLHGPVGQGQHPNRGG